MAQGFGLPLMHWQRLVADVAGEVLPDGRPAYREVIVTVPRQSGKTTLILAWEVHRAIMWGSRQTIAYTAQNGSLARSKLINDQWDEVLAVSPMKSAVRQALRSLGSPALIFKNGSRILALPSTSDAGHGKTLGLAVVDEAYADTDDSREQSFVPTMATVGDAQILYVSTAGTDESVLLNRKVAMGRALAEAGDTESRVAYFEWSADESAKPDDEDSWWDYMPALGQTIEPEDVRHARASMSSGEFRRAYMNIPMATNERVIPAESWRSVVGDVQPSGRLTLAIDACPDPTAGSVVVADASGNAELIAHKVGTDWMLDVVSTAAGRFKADVVIDKRGPVGHLIGPLQDAGVVVVEYDIKDYAYACASFMERLLAESIAVRSHDSFAKAVSAAKKRQVGDTWVWARKGIDSDISPLVALTLALSRRSKPPGVPTISFAG